MESQAGETPRRASSRALLGSLAALPCIDLDTATCLTRCCRDNFSTWHGQKDLRRRQAQDRIAARNLFLPVAKEVITLRRDTDGIDIRNRTLAEILRELAGLPGDQDSFVIYGPAADGLTYMQVFGGTKEGFDAEYQAGTVESDFASRKLLSLAEVQNAFLWYASGDERWKVDIALALGNV